MLKNLKNLGEKNRVENTKIENFVLKNFVLTKGRANLLFFYKKFQSYIWKLPIYIRFSLKKLL